MIAHANTFFQLHRLKPCKMKPNNVYAHMWDYLVYTLITLTKDLLFVSLRDSPGGDLVAWTTRRVLLPVLPSVSRATFDVHGQPWFISSSNLSLFRFITLILEGPLPIIFIPFSKVTRVAWWMKHYGSSTPKRHYCYSNSPAVVRLDKGKLQGWKRDKDPDAPKTAVAYIDRHGIQRFKGTAALKRTEMLAVT